MTSTCHKCEAYAVRTVTLHGTATRVALCSQHYAETFTPTLRGA
jgi:hypothetical protein